MVLSAAHVDLSIVMMLISCLQERLDAMVVSTANLLLLAEKEETRQNRTNPTTPKPLRQTWQAFETNFSDSSFRRTFQIHKNSFHKLCDVLENSVGDKVFKKDSFLLNNCDSNTLKATEFKGGTICGEIKLALTLRMLAGAAYLDMILIFQVVSSTVYSIFHEVIRWVNHALSFPLPALLTYKDISGLSRIANGFGCFTGDSFWGAIGAIDGLAIKIACPSLTEVPDPGNYYCRKGYYALNVQAIVDSYKRFLWVSPFHKGSTHDSTAYYETHLQSVLSGLASFLNRHGFFILGDTAYSLTTYFMVPYDAAEPNSMQDAFNFWHSNSRIRVECAFGKPTTDCLRCVQLAFTLTTAPQLNFNHR